MIPGSEGGGGAVVIFRPCKHCPGTINRPDSGGKLVEPT